MAKGKSFPWWLFAAGVAVVALSGALLGRILTVMRVRVDKAGDGHFGTNRPGHVHEGLDLVAVPGEQVRSPIDGVFVRRGYPYDDDPLYSMAVLAGEGYEVKLMYVLPVATLRPGSRVVRGQVVGIAQDVSQRYGDKMLPHVHVEVRTLDGVLLNPEGLLPLDLA